jgi:signal transduction histidine kinase
MRHSAGQVWWRAGQTAALAGLAVLGFFDMTMGLFAPSLTRPTHPWLDAAEVAAALAAAGVWLTAHRWGDRPLFVAAVAVSLVSLSVTAVPATTTPIGGSFGAAETAALLGLLVVVVRRCPGWTAVLGGVAVGAGVAAQPLRGGHDSDRVITCLFLALLAAGAAAAGAYLRSLDNGRRRQVAMIQAAQRAEFARDLHDFIGHHVSGIVVLAQAAQIVAAHDPPGVISALRQIEQAGGETMASMRRVVGALRELDATPDGRPAAPAGIADLDELVGAFGPPPARLSIEGRVDDLPVELTSSAHRVVMEGLTNVRRHAVGATAVDVLVRRDGDRLLIRVRDDGRPARTVVARERRRGGFGLIGLTERVGSLGGRLHAGPLEGGWLLEAVLPLDTP